MPPTPSSQPGTVLLTCALSRPPARQEGSRTRRSPSGHNGNTSRRTLLVHRGRRQASFPVKLEPGRTPHLATHTRTARGHLSLGPGRPDHPHPAEKVREPCAHSGLCQDTRRASESRARPPRLPSRPVAHCLPHPDLAGRCRSAWSGLWPCPSAWGSGGSGPPALRCPSSGLAL